MKETIFKKDIVDYFDLEAENARKDYDALMKLPLQERIRKRKAIDNLYWDSRYERSIEEGHILYRLTVRRNLSDFKEGDYLLLHTSDMKSVQPCQLYEYDEEDHIIIDIYARNCRMDDSWKGIPLVLDKGMTDLRPSVYHYFTDKLDAFPESWNNKLINTRHKPCFSAIAEADTELARTEKKYAVQFTASQREAILKSMTTDSYYLIQGPPGTGKSFVLAAIIMEELTYYRHKVVVVGPNHMAINNALLQVLKLMPQYSSRIIKVGQLYHAHHLSIRQNNQEYEIKKLTHLNVQACNEMDTPILFGMTPHTLYTRRARDLQFDTLIIDEAGQETIPLALMAMNNARKVILAGDHKQLCPVVASDFISDKMKESIFQRLITEDNSTLLDTSFRMCGRICDFVAGLFYDGKLKSGQSSEGRLRFDDAPSLYSFACPIVLYPVADEGEQFSDKEAESILQIVEYYSHNLGLSMNELGILAPFRAQVSHIRKFIRKSLILDSEEKQAIAIDTIDKMQGQEREVIICSMTAGNLDYMNEMGEFLYNPNKLNVAFSRARSKLIIVAHVHQLESLDKTIYPHIRKMLNSNFVVVNHYQK